MPFVFEAVEPIGVDGRIGERVGGRHAVEGNEVPVVWQNAAIGWCQGFSVYRNGGNEGRMAPLVGDGVAESFCGYEDVIAVVFPEKQRALG